MQCVCDALPFLCAAELSLLLYFKIVFNYVYEGDWSEIVLFQTVLLNFDMKGVIAL